MQFISFPKITGVILLAGAIISATSCKKTEYENAKLPYTAIEKFSMPGYAGDTINGVIIKDTIFVYWDAAAALPQTFTPSLVVSAKASVSPQSGSAVKYAESVAFTVTAESGATQKYTLKFLRTQALPVVTGVNNANYQQWLSGSLISVYGQYFFAGGDTAAVKLYAQRAKDGFEFDLILNKEFSNTTRLTAGLPDYTTAMDTGKVNLKLAVGNRTVDLGQGWIAPPAIDPSYLSIVSRPAKAYPGESLTIKIDDGHNNRVLNWYKGKFSGITLLVADAAGNAAELSIPAITEGTNTLTFKWPAELKNYPGYYIYSITAGYPSYQADGSQYTAGAQLDPNKTDTLYIGTK